MRYRIVYASSPEDCHLVESIAGNPGTVLDKGRVRWVASFKYKEDAEEYVRNKEDFERMDRERQERKDDSALAVRADAEPPYWDDPL